jgi:hypothetical protein
MLTSISMGLLHFWGKVTAEMIDLIGSAKRLGENGTSILSQMKPSGLAMCHQLHTKLWLINCIAEAHKWPQRSHSPTLSRRNHSVFPSTQHVWNRKELHAFGIWRFMSNPKKIRKIQRVKAILLRSLQTSYANCSQTCSQNQNLKGLGRN